MRCVLVALLICMSVAAETVPPIPPLPKTELTAEERAELQKGMEALHERIEFLRHDLAGKPELLELLPDVQIFYNAIRYPLVYHEQIDFKPAQQAITDGMQRAADLQRGEITWRKESGPRGYVSRIDGSVQPYVLMVPHFYKPEDLHRYRLDFVEHGRNEGLTELRMIQTKSDHAVGGSMEKFVVLLYGRYCNANKFAGEIDLLEALDDVKKQYPIDENRILNIGFSMGGAACWQFATHYSDLFAAASPGAGFAESREFLHLSQTDIDATPWYQKKLWHLYDCTDYAANLFNLPTVAYSGEIDPQRQSAEVMAKAMAAEGLKLEQIIGPQTKHAYEKGAKEKLDQWLDELVAKGRDWFSPRVRLVTYTLRYNRMKWVTIDAMEKEWERAEVDAEVNGNAIRAATKNVGRLKLEYKFAPGSRVMLTVDGVRLPDSKAEKNGTWGYAVVKYEKGWSGEVPDGDVAVRKRHGLQGPIDDAFMDRFIIVKPTGTAANQKIAAWTQSECQHAIEHWRKQFRGEAIVKNDKEITDDDIASSNLVLFGDSNSNKILARIADRLPIHWTAQSISVGSHGFDSAHHALVAIYPNPLNPQRYIVLNSGFTFREYDYLNNARQIPKLPDYAVIDVDEPPTPRTPGKVVDAGFFGERWELLADEGR